MHKISSQKLQSLKHTRELLETGEFHGRSYRKYSDGSVKAVTSSGWKKFKSFDEFCDYHWKNHYNKSPVDKKRKFGWLKRIFNPALSISSKV